MRRERGGAAVAESDRCQRRKGRTGRREEEERERDSLEGCKRRRAMVESESKRVLRRRALDHLAEDRPKAGKSAAGGSTMTPPQYIPNPIHRTLSIIRSNIHQGGYVRIITSSASSEDPPPNIPFFCLIASSKPIIPVYPRARARRPLPSNPTFSARKRESTEPAILKFPRDSIALGTRRRRPGSRRAPRISEPSQ